MPGEGAPAAFAIFDGHSGKETARICSETVCQRLMQKGPPFEPEAIKDMLWAIDEEIGLRKIRDGATAQARVHARKFRRAHTLDPRWTHAECMRARARTPSADCRECTLHTCACVGGARVACR